MGDEWRVSEYDHPWVTDDVLRVGEILRFMILP